MFAPVRAVYHSNILFQWDLFSRTPWTSKERGPQLGNPARSKRRTSSTGHRASHERRTTGPSGTEREGSFARVESVLAVMREERDGGSDGGSAVVVCHCREILGSSGRFLLGYLPGCRCCRHAIYVLLIFLLVLVCGISRPCRLL